MNHYIKHILYDHHLNKCFEYEDAGIKLNHYAGKMAHVNYASTDKHDLIDLC